MADIEPHLSRVGDKSLRHVLSSGVAFLHATMTAAEKEVVTLLFNSGAIQVGICCIQSASGCHVC